MIKKIFRRLQSGIKDKDNKELVRGGAVALMMRFLSIVSSYLFTFLIARGYGATGTGIYTIYQAVLQFFSTVSKMGFNVLLMRSTAEYAAQDKWSHIKDLYYKSLRFTVFTSIFFSVLVYFTSGYIAAGVFLKPELKPYIQIAAFSILPLVLMGIHADCLRGLKKILLYTFLEGASVLIVASVMLVSLLFFFSNKEVPLWAYLAGLIVSAALSILWWWRKSGLEKISVTDTVNFTEKFSVAFTLFTTAILQIFRTWTDSFLLGRFSTEEALGIYKVAFRISTITSISLTAILLTVAPKIAELYSKGDIRKMTLITQNATKLIFWSSIPLLVLFVIFPEFFLGIFGEEFKQGALVLIIMCVGQFINAATGPVSNVLIMTGKQKINRNVLFVATVLTVILNFIFIPLYGITAAAIINTIGYFVINIVPMIIVRYYYGFYTINIRTLFSFKLALEDKKK